MQGFVDFFEFDKGATPFDDETGNLSNGKRKVSYKDLIVSLGSYIRCRGLVNT